MSILTPSGLSEALDPKSDWKEITSRAIQRLEQRRVPLREYYASPIEQAERMYGSLGLAPVQLLNIEIEELDSFWTAHWKPDAAVDLLTQCVDPDILEAIRHTDPRRISRYMAANVSDTEETVEALITRINQRLAQWRLEPIASE